jgi:hypothetical protein
MIPLLQGGITVPAEYPAGVAPSIANARPGANAKSQASLTPFGKPARLLLVRFLLDLFLGIFLDVLIHMIRKIQVLVDIAGIRVLGIRADRE